MNAVFILAASALAITAMICLAATRAWRGWLALKRLEIERRAAPSEAAEDEIGVRIELASVRERLRQLEAIAEGVEL
ncbi:MAG TPA: hypothetical protein VES64_07810 [Allosphingosinicella sp.]|nr:hypothetical protein [Allosphingosinicella sp.]